jgi:hypothetical protein
MHMAGPSATRHGKSWLHKWFGPNRGTHWSVAGAVAVILLGGYLIYSNHDGNPPTTPPLAAAQQTPAPMAPAPVNAQK